jgi:serine/threonine-protein kinase
VSLTRKGLGETRTPEDGLDATLAAGRLVAGRYRLARRLAGGGMGEVWLAEHTGLDAPVAVKFMHPKLVAVPPARTRFEREAKAAAQIRSPHVVHVYDHGIDDGVPFIVMEYLEGEDLGQRLRRTEVLAPQAAVRLCTQVARGLHRAHRLGIVHRDLKPGNIFLSKADDDMVKILDFGIAKETGRPVVSGEATTSGTVLGSPHYMSPEQCRGLPVGPASDLWALGVILFRVITGRRPFEASDVGDLIVRICTDPVPRASEVSPILPAAMDGFFQRALAREAGERFGSAPDLAYAFAAALLGAEGGTVGVRQAAPSWDELPGLDPDGAPESWRAPDATGPSRSRSSAALAAALGPRSAPAVSDRPEDTLTTGESTPDAPTEMPIEVSSVELGPGKRARPPARRWLLGLASAAGLAAILVLGWRSCVRPAPPLERAVASLASALTQPTREPSPASDAPTSRAALSASGAAPAATASAPATPPPTADRPRQAGLPTPSSRPRARREPELGY